jgi:hypothetical protein
LWSEIFTLPRLTEHEPSEPALRRRRRNAVRWRRPKFLMRRRSGASFDPAQIHHGEREIIARD